MLMKLPARCLALHIFVSYTFICAESSTMYTVLHTHNESNWSGGPAFASFAHFDWCLTHLSWKYYKVHTHWIQPASNWSGGPAIASFALLTTPTPQSETQQNVFKLFKMPKKTVNTTASRWRWLFHSFDPLIHTSGGVLSKHISFFYILVLSDPKLFFWNVSACWNTFQYIYFILPIKIPLWQPSVSFLPSKASSTSRLNSLLEGV